ncbi:MAG: dockerin type I repeat-containing protein [Myxococcota bacterium]
MNRIGIAAAALAGVLALFGSGVALATTGGTSTGGTGTSSGTGGSTGGGTDSTSGSDTGSDSGGSTTGDGPAPSGTPQTCTAAFHSGPDLDALLDTFGASDVDALAASVPVFVRGDASGDGTVGIDDAIKILDYLFQGGGAPPCMDAADVNDDGNVGLDDAVVTLNHLFMGEPVPSAGFGHVTVDATADGLDCDGQDDPPAVFCSVGVSHDGELDECGAYGTCVAVPGQDAGLCVDRVRGNFGVNASRGEPIDGFPVLGEAIFESGPDLLWAATFASVQAGDEEETDYEGCRVPAGSTYVACSGIPPTELESGWSCEAGGCPVVGADGTTDIVTGLCEVRTVFKPTGPDGKKQAEDICACPTPGGTTGEEVEEEDVPGLTGHTFVSDDGNCAYTVTYTQSPQLYNEYCVESGSESDSHGSTAGYQVLEDYGPGVFASSYGHIEGAMRGSDGNWRPNQLHCPNKTVSGNSVLNIVDISDPGHVLSWEVTGPMNGATEWTKNGAVASGKFLHPSSRWSMGFHEAYTEVNGSKTSLSPMPETSIAPVASGVTTFGVSANVGGSVGKKVDFIPLVAGATASVSAGGGFSLSYSFTDYTWLNGVDAHGVAEVDESGTGGVKVKQLTTISTEGLIAANPRFADMANALQPWLESVLTALTRANLPTSLTPQSIIDTIATAINEALLNVDAEGTALPTGCYESEVSVALACDGEPMGSLSLTADHGEFRECSASSF